MPYRPQNVKKKRRSREHPHRPVCYQPQDPITVLTTEKSYFASLPNQKKTWAAWRHFLGAKKTQIQARERVPGKAGFIPSHTPPHSGQKAQEGVPALQSVLHGSESLHNPLLPLLLSEMSKASSLRIFRHILRTAGGRAAVARARDS